MSSFWAVFKRELKSYFTTPLAYVFLVIFLFFAGYLTFKQGFYEAQQADLQAFFTNLPLLFVFMVPSTAMRLWAEERKIGSIELLLTLPVTITQAVLGKFFAAWLFLGIALALTFPMIITVAYLGDPDGGLIATGYLGSFLMAGGFLAVGSFFSAVSKNQVIAFVLSVVACAVLVFAGMPTTLNYLSSFLPSGLVVILIAGWIAACTVILDERKAS
jgi:ABC-2 type transport system permease protein